MSERETEPRAWLEPRRNLRIWTCIAMCALVGPAAVPSESAPGPRSAGPSRSPALASAGRVPTERGLTAIEGGWAELAFGGRKDHAAIYDPTRDRVIVFGGAGNGNEVLQLGPGPSPTWTQLETSGTPPSARWGHSAIYDAVRDRMLVFGGYDGTRFLDEVWSLSFAGVPTWTKLTPTGTPPFGRAEHGAIYDPLRDRMVVYAGHRTGGYESDLWALSLTDPPAWSAVEPVTSSRPNARDGRGLVYDPVRDRLVMCGGSFYADTWAFSMADTVWTRLTPTGPAPAARRYRSIVYDPTNDRLLVFGGETATYVAANEVRALSLKDTPNWTVITAPDPAPDPRCLHVAIYDAARGRMVVFGGRSGHDSSEHRFPDTWALTFWGTAAWTRLGPAAAPPDAGFGSRAIHDPVRGRMVVFGGSDDGSPSNAVFALPLDDPPAWSALEPAGTPPVARENHTAIYDPVRDRIVVFGGWTSDGGAHFLNDAWALSLAGTPTWSPITPAGAPPAARDGHSAIYDPVRDRMLVFGGRDAVTRYNDVWTLSLAGPPVWTELSPAGTPPGVIDFHSAIYDPIHDRMIVYGAGDLGGGPHAWALSLGGVPTWSVLEPTGAPPSVWWGHVAIYDALRARMTVVGGNGTYGQVDGIWGLSLTGPLAWTDLTPAGSSPAARWDHTAIYDPAGDRVVMFGGTSSAGEGAGFVVCNDVWAVRFDATVGIGDPPARDAVGGLRSPSPDPCRGDLTVSYSIPRPGRVWLGLYDVAGRLVCTLINGQRRAGAETVVWNGAASSGARVGPGIYFVSLAGPGVRMTRKVVVLR